MGALEGQAGAASWSTAAGAGLAAVVAAAVAVERWGGGLGGQTWQAERFYLTTISTLALSAASKPHTSLLAPAHTLRGPDKVWGRRILTAMRERRSGAARRGGGGGGESWRQGGSEEGEARTCQGGSGKRGGKSLWQGRGEE